MPNSTKNLRIPRSARTGTRPDRRPRLERLEQRQLLASDLIGVVSPDGRWQIDLNRDEVTEISRKFGLPGDQFVSGNWEGTGGQFAAARARPDGFLQWYLNADPDGTPLHEVDFVFGLEGDIAVAGDWNGDGRDNVGVVRENRFGGLDWYKDLSRDPAPQQTQTFGLHNDIPVVGDWNNDGISDVGVVRSTESDHLEWFFDTTGDRWSESERIFGVVGDVPVVGDWNGDGKTNIGVARRVGTPSGERWAWHLSTASAMNPEAGRFADIPVFVSGDASHRPVVGDWRFSQFAISSEDLQFGETQLGVPVTRSVTVTNTGNAPLVLRPLGLPDGFTVESDFGNTLPPGRSGSLSVQLDGVSVGVKGGPMVLETNDGHQPSVELDLQGTVLSLPELARGEVRGGAVPGRGESLRYRFHAESRERFELNAATSDPNQEIELRVIRPDGEGNRVRRVVGSGRHEFSIPRFHQGEFIIDVRAGDGGSNGSFWIGLESVSTPSTNAADLRPRQIAQGRIESPVQVDQYKIESEGGERWSVEIVSGTALDATVFKPGGALKNTGSVQQNFSGVHRFGFSVNPYESGTYILAIRSHENISDAAYQVRIWDENGRQGRQRDPDNVGPDGSGGGEGQAPIEQIPGEEGDGVPQPANVPTRVALSDSQVVENAATGSASLLVGSLLTELAVEDDSETYLYELEASGGATDNLLFEIVDDELFVKQGTSIDFETKSEYLVRVRVTTGSGATTVHDLTVSVVDLLEVRGVVVNGGSPQRSRVETLSVEFDGEAVMTADAFQVSKLGEGGGVVDFAVTTATVDGGTVATLEFEGGFTESGSLVDGNYRLRVDGTKVSRPGGELLDADRNGRGGGEWLFGDEATDRFFRLFGDMDGDGDVDITDLNDFFIPAFGTLAGQAGYRPELDADADGDIDITDLNDHFVPNFGVLRPELPADSDDFGVIWTEDAEGGLTHIVDGSDAEYTLIQSVHVAEGENAFHLAHPSTASNWFEIDRTLTIGDDTRLFFMSRLSWATTTQVARVQISTDGGQTWPATVYSQAGENGGGDRGFMPRQVDLSDFAGQEVRIRFLYEYAGGSRYPQISPGIGWMIDDIRVASRFETSEYSIGEPTDLEQQMLEYANRGRADAIAEAQRLADEAVGVGGPSQQIIADYDAALASGEFEQHAQPLTFNAILLDAARLHSQDMLDNGFQSHRSSANPPEPFSPGFGPTQRSAALGYGGGVGENAFAYAGSVPHAHSAFSNSGGHRRNLHHGGYNEVGFAAVPGSNGNIGPLVVTQKFGNSGGPFITGVIFEDHDEDAFYTPGEGLGGIRIDVVGATYHGVSAASGGYAVPVPGDGEYLVTFSGTGIESWSTRVVVTAGESVKVDYVFH